MSVVHLDIKSPAMERDENYVKLESLTYQHFNLVYPLSKVCKVEPITAAVWPK